MRRFVAFVLAGLFLAAATSKASAAITTLNFDDLSANYDWYVNGGNQHWGVLSGTYGGLNWTNWEVANAADYKVAFGNTAFPSYTGNFLYNASGIMKGVETTGNSFFTFVGADVATWAQGNVEVYNSANSLTIKGYASDVEKFSVTVNPLSTTNFVDFFNGLVAPTDRINKLTFEADRDGKWWILDNFKYETAVFGSTGSQVPEPASIAIWSLLGLGCLFGGRIMRSRKVGGGSGWSEENRAAIRQIIERA